MQNFVLYTLNVILIMTFAVVFLKIESFKFLPRLHRLKIQMQQTFWLRVGSQKL